MHRTQFAHLRIIGCFAVLLAYGSLSALVLPTPASYAQSSGYSLRFYGNGVNGIDRVKIAIDNPARPADIGTSDFTIEFWMKASQSENTSGGCTSGGDNWIYGNMILDRDIYGGGDYGDFGISLAGGRIAFGAHNGSSGQTLCGTTNVADGSWHHIAVTRRQADGRLSIFVDGRLDAQVDGPDGNISYRDGRSTQYANDPFLVIGAEKHDYNKNVAPSFSGWIDEMRLSKILRYSSTFTPASQPFATDSNTVALYHLDEGSSNTINDSSGAAGGPSNGTRQYGGTPAGPVWSAETPWGASTPTAPPAPTATASSTSVATQPPTATPIPSSTATPPPTATAIPSSTATPPPVGDYALDFDGIDDQVRGSQIVSTGGSQTIEAWIRPASNNQNALVLLTTDDNLGWSLEINNGQATWWGATGPGQWSYARNTHVTLTAGAWYHIAVTHNGATARVYVNGDQGDATPIGAVTQGPWFRLGGLSGPSYFKGRIDQARLSNTVRYTSAFSPPAVLATDSATQALYHFDEGTDQTARDLSGHNNHLTLGASAGSDTADPIWAAR